ncbi:hypothetical protein E1258_18665 [Micromonospora sp. KC207]|uniref:hypothetical protein n=1 Tax=Micromonospora sp. KC207 TaxID=2530377 RepID=UPI001042BC86|nr:hypothetical protein [Micromonospora sp. KC207]TDC59239.1 hypothetical protein E1258_18665 [Micromonospora sp. KC207]
MFADALHADGIRVDVLVNNAGIMMPPRSQSAQGHESQFTSNHLGHFALTGLVLDLLEAAPTRAWSPSAPRGTGVARSNSMI